MDVSASSSRPPALPASYSGSATVLLHLPYLTPPKQELVPAFVSYTWDVSSVESARPGIAGVPEGLPPYHVSEVPVFERPRPVRREGMAHR